MVECDNHVIEPNGERRNTELVEGRTRHTFDGAGQFISEQTGPAALKRGQIGPSWLWQLRQPLGKFCKRIAAIRRVRHPLDRVSRDERISPQLRVPHCTVEEQNVRQVAQSTENVDWSE